MGISWRKGVMQMELNLVYPAGSTPASRYAAAFLETAGIPVIDHPSPEVTHLLLDVPSFGPNGLLRGGGEIETMLAMLPPEVTVIGGNLQHPALRDTKTLDLLKDPRYVAVNAAITADCALRAAAEKLPSVFRDTSVLIIGWGRIGKCLGQMLKALGAKVTVGARKACDRAMLEALGYDTLETETLGKYLPQFRVIYNTAPVVILSEEELSRCPASLKIDLASKRGLLGENVIWAKGLPGVYAPESSGALIGETIMRSLRGKEI